MRRKNITALAFAALFAALISAGALIAIPIGPVPVALQNLFALLSGMALGPALGGAAVGLFIAAGAIGVPVFANNGSPMGFARIAGPSGGYLLGYLLGAFAAGLIMGFPRSGQQTPLLRIILAAVAGLLVVYIPGLIRLKLFLDASWTRTLAAGFFPFIIGDAVKGIIAVLITPRLRRAAAQLLEK
ncbi:MAG: biotin transporter BioY [Treponema sp.]|jgi:biotin transport system substrate-specific component|nr:biotin transporter BioY [Treponema sp.]